MTRRPARAGGDEDGMTLVEVLVATVIFGIVGSLATAGLITVMKSQRQIDARTRAQAQNRIGIELVTRLIRQATYPRWNDQFNSTIVTLAEPRRLIFTTRGAPGADILEHEFKLEGSELRWGTGSPVCPVASPAPGSGLPGCEYPGDPALTRVAVRDVGNALGGGPCLGAPPNGALFTYFEADATNGTLTALPFPVSGDRLNRIDSISMSLFVKEDLERPIPRCEELRTRVNLRNLRP